MASEHTPQRARRARDDTGVVVVLVAAIIGALLVMVALVLDLSGARRDRDADQVAADAMALAAANSLGGADASAVPACKAAWAYLVVNLPVAKTAPAPSCTAFAAACVAATAREVQVTIDEYRLTLTHPVPAGHALLDGQAAGSLDGKPCDRIGVRIRQTRSNLVAGGSVALDVDAVGRYLRGVGDVSAPLILLEPHACGVLNMGGNSILHVATATGEPGSIAIDSDGSGCTNPNKVIVDIYGNAVITAGVVSMWALADGDPTGAYTPGLTLTPLPTASSAPVGRSAVDWRYNCSAANGCPGPGPAHIDDLKSDWGGAGQPLPLGSFTSWTASGRSCSLTGAMVVPAGNWYIDCGSGGLSSSGDITFQGGNIVSDGPITAGGNSGLRVNCSDANPADAIAPATCPSDPPSAGIFFQRTGALMRDGNGALELQETFVYLAGGTMDMSGNSKLIWTAPNDPTHRFDDLAFWTENTNEVKLTGNSSIYIEGIVFVPNATLSLSGNTGTEALDAQIFARTAMLAGNAELTLKPRFDRILQVGKGRPVLIR